MGLFDDLDSAPAAPAAAPAKAAGGKAAPKTDTRASAERFADAASAALGVPRDAVRPHMAMETGHSGERTVGQHNYANIKAGPGWTGKTVTKNVTEYDAKGRPHTRKEVFRAYDNEDEAAQDYVRLIREKYPNAATAKTPQEYAKALKAGGYATDPDYVRKYLGTLNAVKRSAPLPAATPAKGGGGLFADLGEAAPEPAGPAQIPGMSPEVQALASGMPGQPQAPAAPAEEPGMWDKIKGAGETALALGTSIPAGLAGGAAGLYKGLTGGKYGTTEGAQEAAKRAEEVTGKLTYSPRTESGRAMTKDIGELVQKSGIAGIPLPELAALGRATAPAAELAKLGGKAALGKVGAAMPSVAPKLAPETAALAKRAADFGIPLRPDMLTDNKFMRMLGDTLDKVPMSGSTTPARTEAFNRALIKLIGGDTSAKRITPDVFAGAIEKSGSAIGDMFERTSIPLDKDLQDALVRHVENAAKFETADVQRALGSYVQELRDKAKGGVIPGEAFRKLNTQIGAQMRRTANGDLKHALGELQEDMHEALQRNLSGADLEALQTARKQYAMAKQLEPLVAKSPTGDISPAALMGRVTSTGSGKAAMARGGGGDLGDLARVGQKFLKEPASSGTAERGAAYGMLGGGAVANPLAAGGIYGLANIYNRLGPALSRKILSAQDIQDIARYTNPKKAP